ncbi:DUF2125 domain-containing protein [Litoreibacter arenae]|uniref:High-affinity K+ transport system, ATPase chain B n=1 Tax=Litoreibacter arenae DSM 19593 TaxID=1123360 RepID=S9RRM6_9RHOB|nr:DUF2125 domain-containing protein [Litoreibacter arenae]EPX80680.1 High-affinity K+ transport system, ATPase chain B [Litoreibacter arenae DSM 19593]
MRKLLIVVVVAATAWAAYWVVGATASQKATEGWLDARRAEGWQVEYSDLKVRGFPNRFDTTITDVQLTDPDTGLSWSAPFFQIFSLSYQPNHLIAAWPNTQTLATPFQKINLETSKMTASLKVLPNSRLELDSATVVVEGANLTSTQGWTSAADKVNAAIRRTVGKEMTYDIAAQADTVTPGDALRDLVDAGGTLPDVIEGFTFDSEIAFASPLDIRVIEDRRPDITTLAVKDASGTWGELRLRAKGDLTVDSDGYPSGEIALNARNWREMLTLAVSAGAVPAEAASAVELGLGFLAKLSGSENSLDAPLTFSNARMFLGPIPLGPAPTLNLR